MFEEQMNADDLPLIKHPDFGWGFRLSEPRFHKSQQNFQATAKQLEELGTYLELHSLNKFVVECMVKPKRSNAYFDIYMKLTTTGSQSCVATAEPVGFKVQTSETQNVTVELPQLPAGETQLNEPDLDGPDYIERGFFDPLKMAIELLILELDPYPRKEDADLVNEQDELTKDDIKPNPFAGLSALKDKLG